MGRVLLPMARVDPLRRRHLNMLPPSAFPRKPCLRVMLSLLGIILELA